jgi:diguanylate cyclase (GGDEF)-like protein
MSKLLDNYQQRFHRNIYFVDAQGVIKMTGKSMRDVHGPISGLPGVSSIASQILNNSPVPTELEYQRKGATVLLSSRFIPEMDWYLLVEQDISDEVKPIRRVFYVNIAISAAITLLVLALTLLAINRYQRRLEAVAGTDSLTGLLNRQAFEFVFQQAMLDSERRGSALSAVLFDIDHFKMVNDNYGHLAGDRILRQIAETVRHALRESDIVTRWGGEEFLVLLKDCPLQQAALIAEKLRQAIAKQEFVLSAGTLSLTASLGVAEYECGESSTSFFSRADKALYRAKTGGRNRSEVSSEEAAQPGV